MKRLVILAAFGIVLLSACRRAGEFPSDEVLRRSTSASAQLLSAEYDVSVDLAVANGMLTLQGQATLQGTLGSGGQQAAFTAIVNGSMARAGGDTEMQLTADVVSELADSYVRVSALKLTPEPALLAGNRASWIGKWWKIPREGGNLPLQPLTPDPQFLRAQAAVVTVTKDFGLEDINGRDAYRYAVSIDPERLVALMQESAEKRGKPFDAALARTELAQYDATGELWIDAETFVLHRFSWTVSAKDRPSALRLHFIADLRNHNGAAPITVPADYQVFSRELLLKNLLPLSTGSGGAFSL